MPVWDNPRLLNFAANALFTLALALAAYGAGRVLFQSPAFPLRSIRIVGDLQHATRAQFIDALQGRVKGTFFTVDLESLRVLFEGVAWVRRADVRRLWPDRLEVRIEEQVPLARWGQGAEARLVNTYGEVFPGRSDSTLPLFSGPAGSEGEVTRRYAAFRGLLQPLALEPQQVLLSSRLAWQLKLSNGLTVQLGRDSDKDRVDDRLAKFISVYPQTLGNSGRTFDYVDLRYPNGFALRMPENRNFDSPKTARKRV
jgi:cell division protein FtsQ